MAGEKTSRVILRKALEHTKANYKKLFVTALIVYGSVFLYQLLCDQIVAWMRLSLGKSNVVAPLTGILLSVFGAALLMNNKAVALVILKGGTPEIRKTAQQFSKAWERYLGIQVWSTFWIYLWSLLFFVPGIVKGLSYMLAPYMVIEYPKMTIKKSLRKSIEITKGYKGRLFLISLIAFAPFLLSGCFSLAMTIHHNMQYQLYIRLYTLLVSLFLTEPFANMMFGVAYLDIKKASIRNGMLPKEP